MSIEKRKILSVVVPCYDEEAAIAPFLEALPRELEVELEIVFVDDGSSDSTLAEIKKAAKRDARVRYVAFSRNFGKEAAMLAGLRKATGDYVVTMDVDLQDPPELLPDMLSAVRDEGFDCAATRRVTRKGEPFLRSWFARGFYRAMRRFSDVELVDGARDYRLMTRQVADAVRLLPEVNRFTKGIYQWVGFKTKWISFENRKRSRGESKWSFWGLFRYAVDGLLAFSTMPLQIASCLGFCCCLLSFASLLFVVVRKLVCGDPVAGWPSLVCLIVFFGGMQLFFVGVLGSYLAKTYRETKRRPPYIVREES